MRLMLQLFFLVFSLGIYFNAPINYSFSICLLINILFILQNLIHFTSKKFDLISFEFIFMISFYFLNFVYPVFYYPTRMDFSVFSLSYNHAIITKATSLALVAYSSYLLGLIVRNRRNNKRQILSEKNKYSFENLYLSYINKSLFIISIILLALYLLSGGHVALSSEYSGEEDVVIGIYSYYYILLNITTSILCFFIFKETNKINQKNYILFIFSIIILFLLLGSRTLPLTLVLSLIFAYNRYRKIPKVVFISLLILGMLSLTFVMFARSASYTSGDYFSQGIENFEIINLWDLGSDLLINNRNLYVIVDYVYKGDYTFGITMLSGFLSPIPFLQSFIAEAFGIPKDFMSTSSFVTFLELGPGSTWGLGGHVVGDVYLSFGLLGTIILFYFFGYIISMANYKSYSNIYWYIFYFVFASNSVYIGRTGLFDNMRTIIWSLLIVYFIISIKKIKKKKFNEV